MLRRAALIALVAALAGVAMLATVPAATATTEPAVTFFVLVPVNDARVVISCPACPGHHQFRRGWAAHFDVVNKGTKPYTVDIGGLRTRELRAGTEAAPQRLLRQSRAVPVQGRGQHPAARKKAGFASSSPWPAAPGLPRGGHRCNRRIERRGGDRPA